MTKHKRKPTFQLIIQIGLFPRIKRYFVSPVQYFSKDAAVTAGEKYLTKEGYEVSRKFIHTRRVVRGTNCEPKYPQLERNIPPQQRESTKVEYWIHEPKLRKQLGIKAAY